MFYKLSNTANLKDIEKAFNASFKYPLLYRKTHLINGLLEQSIPIITMAKPHTVNYAIWGLLPQRFKEGWGSFQNLTNTLNVSIESISEFDWINPLLRTQRCIVIVSGYFTSYFYNGEVYPFYVYERNHRPFALAGVYSELDDGFLSVSIITSNLQNELEEVHNLGKEFPIALDAENYKQWLELDENQILDNIDNMERLELNAHTITKEFYKNDIIFDDILEPATYRSLPILSLK